MTWQVVLAHANCFIEVSADHPTPGGTGYAARPFVLDDTRHELRPLAFPDGQRVVVAAPTEPAAVNAAIGLLEGHFGALSLPAHHPTIDRAPQGPPLVLSR